MTQQQGLGAAAALHDPVRRSLLHLAGVSPQPLTREAAALALGLPRSTVAFHLDRLVDSGLLVVQYERVNGRSGPGSGRPAKTYTRAPDELNVSIPQRHYDLMGDMLATAIETAADAGSALHALRAAAAAAGRRAGQTVGTFAQLLDEFGYEPMTAGHTTVLANCPFHRLARDHTAVVCAANHAFLCAVAEATGNNADTVLLEPTAGHCCVTIET